MKSPSQKLSKSDGDSGIRELRAKGWSAEEVIGQAAALVGLLEKARPVRANAVAELIRGPDKVPPTADQVRSTTEDTGDTEGKRWLEDS
jgi:hypothetical protein